MRTSDRSDLGAAAAPTDDVGAIDAALAKVEAGLDDLATMDVTALPSGCVVRAIRRLGRLDGRIDGLQARLVTAAERAGVPERAGATSTTSWLSRETGRSGGQAARTTRLAKAADAVPELVDEVAAGTVGPDQAGNLASALDRDELDASDVTELLPAARRLPPAMLGRETRRAAGERRQRRLRDQELAAKDERYLTTWRTDNGSLRIDGQLPPAVGDTFEKALSAFYVPDGAEVPDDLRRTHRQRTADALRDLTEASLRVGAAGEVGGALPQLTVLVPFEAMAPLAAAAAAGATAVTDLDTVLSASEVAKLACDAAFTRLVLDPDGIPLDVGRTTRKWSGSQRAAITAIDGGCRAPGCDLPPHRCVIHHVTWWRDGGPTSPDNGLLLCHHGHDLVHDDGWRVEMDPATRIAVWTAPDGTTHTTHPRGPAAPRATESPPRDRVRPAQPVVSHDSTRPPTNPRDHTPAVTHDHDGGRRPQRGPPDGARPSAPQLDL